MQRQRRLGGLEVSAVGLGCATMTPFYDAPDPASAHRHDPPGPRARRRFSRQLRTPTAPAATRS